MSGLWSVRGEMETATTGSYTKFYQQDEIKVSK